jgi:hypothetical protein
MPTPQILIRSYNGPTFKCRTERAVVAGRLGGVLDDCHSGGQSRGKTVSSPESGTSATTPTGTESGRSAGRTDARGPGGSFVRGVPLLQ